MKCIHCGREASFKFKNGNWCCSNHPSKCLKVREVMSIKSKGKNTKNPKLINALKGRIPWNKGVKGYKIHSEIFKENLRKEMIEYRSSKMNTKEHIEKIRQRMLDGGGAYAYACRKNPSKPQVELYQLVLNFFPNAIINYIFDKKCIDIAVPELMIAIEYDGSFWHQDEEKDIKRQNKLESLGWKFIRYKDIIPSKDKILEDIINLGG